MTVTAYLFGFTLTMVFEGNKSEFARRLNIRRTDFNRIEKRLCAGSSSVQTLEAVLQLLCEMHISVDRALVGYRRELTALSEHPDLQQRRESILVVHEEFTRIWMHAGNRMRIFKSAEAFLTELERCFCNVSCVANRDCLTECPCKRFAEYMEWLHREMERPMTKQQE
ncbi:hypothetical protein [Butyricicoccus sp.]|uniref:hypothetical protein n=1 Tax=Butyricicoccus sp. TaxID=2049021 RepID=UPI003AABB67C